MYSNVFNNNSLQHPLEEGVNINEKMSKTMIICNGERNIGGRGVGMTSMIISLLQMIQKNESMIHELSEVIL